MGTHSPGFIRPVPEPHEAGGGRPELAVLPRGHTVPQTAKLHSHPLPTATSEQMDGRTDGRGPAGTSGGGRGGRRRDWTAVVGGEPRCAGHWGEREAEAGRRAWEPRAPGSLQVTKSVLETPRTQLGKGRAPLRRGQRWTRGASRPPQARAAGTRGHGAGCPRRPRAPAPGTARPAACHFPSARPPHRCGHTAGLAGNWGSDSGQGRDICPLGHAPPAGRGPSRKDAATRRPRHRVIKSSRNESQSPACS